MTRPDRFRTLDSSEYDAIVVGAGTGGLTTAALLATRGKKVLVVDQHYVAGGNGTVFKRPGYEFDVGIHYIGGCGDNGMIARILRAAGAGDVEFEELDPDGFDTIVLPDLEFRYPKGIDAFRARLLETFPAERRGIDRYIKLMRQIQRFQQMLANPLAALWTIPRSLLLMRWANRTFGDFLDSCTTDERLKAVLAGQSGDYAQPPSRASVLMGVGLTLHYLEEGAFFPKGGGQVISDRLAEVIEHHGGKILLRATVERIHVTDGRVTGVTFHNKHTGRRTVTAPIVVSNADLKQTVDRLIGHEHLRATTVERVGRYEMSPALAVVYLGIDRDLLAEGHPRTNYWLFPSYDQERCYAHAAAGEHTDEPFAYISIASLKDPTNTRLAPDGVTNLQIMTVAPSAPEAWGVTEEDVRTGAYSDSPAYSAAKRALADRLLASAERVLPGIRSQVVYQEVSTPLTHRRYTLSTGGTSYGIALTPEQFLRNRPSARTEIEGLYLCGASCRTGHGIGGVMMSGVVAAGAILGVPLAREVFGKRNARRPGRLPARAELGVSSA